MIDRFRGSAPVAGGKRKVSPCRCGAYPFPHRWLSGKCYDAHDLAEPVELAPCSLPGREHFDSDEDYWRAVNSDR